MSLATILNRARGSGVDSRKTANPIRMSGTNEDVLTAYEREPKDAELGDAIGRQGNDWRAPSTDPVNQINLVNGDRYQDFANTHLSEGEAPGRIPRQWKDLVRARARGTTGTPSGLISDVPQTGQEDQMYIQHTQIPRGSTLARAFSRTVDDAAAIPGVYISDPSRR